MHVHDHEQLLSECHLLRPWYRLRRSSVWGVCSHCFSYSGVTSYTRRSVLYVVAALPMLSDPAHCTPQLPALTCTSFISLLQARNILFLVISCHCFACLVMSSSSTRLPISGSGLPPMLSPRALCTPPLPIQSSTSCTRYCKPSSCYYSYSCGGCCCYCYCCCWR
jgi:hypothetical protein